MRIQLLSRPIHLLAALAFALVIGGCSSPDPLSPEQAVRTTLEQLEVAAESRSLSAFMEHVSEDYQDHKGYTWEDIQRLVQFEYIRNQSIHIFTDIKELQVNGDIATVELNAAMASRASDLEDVAGRLKADTHSLSLVLKQTEPQTWKVESVSWQRGWR